MRHRVVRAWLYLAATVVLEVAPTLCLRASAGFSVLLPSLVSVLGYGAAVVFLSRALRAIPMSVAYVVWTGLGTSLIVIFSFLLFGDTMTSSAWAGVVLVVGGVTMVNARRGATAEGSDAGEEHPQRS
jgi:small multidrug resistance pump